MPWTILREDDTTEDTFECPRYHMEPTALHLIQLKDSCDMFEALPFAGGVADQPGPVVDAFRVISIRQAFWKKKEQAAAAAKNNKGAR